MKCLQSSREKGVRLLLDTEIWLWSLTTPERMSDDARRALEDAANELYLSAASAGEISIKAKAGAKRAIVAVARQLLLCTRRMLLDAETYLPAPAV